MKKRLLLLPLVIPIIGLSGCGKDKKIELKRDDTLKDPVALNAIEFKNKIDNNDSFVMFVESKSCSSCLSFKNVVKEFISETNAIIYSIQTSEADTLFKYFTYKITPTLFVFSEGKQFAKTDYNSGNLNTINTFTKYLNKYTYLSPIIRTSEEKLQKMIDENKTFIVRYTWDKCGDCNASNKYFYSFFKSNASRMAIYEFELSYYYENRKDKEDKLWTDLTAKFGLSKDGSPEFGWKNGVVPTYQYRELGVIKDQVVVYNEEYDNENGVLKVIGSYFKDGETIGKTYKATKDESAYQVYMRKTANYFLSKVKKLISKLYNIK